MDALAALDLEVVRADNPSPFTLEGTNTWLVGRDPCWVVDPGPADGRHVAAVTRAAEGRGGLGGIALTHDHLDHTEAVGALVEAAGRGRDVPVAALGPRRRRRPARRRRRRRPARRGRHAGPLA